jgi:hypothetical protein
MLLRRNLIILLRFRRKQLTSRMPLNNIQPNSAQSSKPTRRKARSRDIISWLIHLTRMRKIIKAANNKRYQMILAQ